MPAFAEELVLLLHGEDGGPLPIQKDAFDCALAFAGRIDTDPQALPVTDPAPTGDAVQDRVLARRGGRNDWRLAHAVLGLCCLLLLLAHTGFRLGSDLEAALTAAYGEFLRGGGVRRPALFHRHLSRPRRR